MTNSPFPVQSVVFELIQTDWPKQPVTSLALTTSRNYLPPWGVRAPFALGSSSLWADRCLRALGMTCHLCPLSHSHTPDMPQWGPRVNVTTVNLRQPPTHTLAHIYRQTNTQRFMQLYPYKRLKCISCLSSNELVSQNGEIRFYDWLW